MRMNLIKAHGVKGSRPFSFERSATFPPQADHVLVVLSFICGGPGGCVKAPRQRWTHLKHEKTPGGSQAYIEPVKQILYRANKVIYTQAYIEPVEQRNALW